MTDLRKMDEEPAFEMLRFIKKLGDGQKFKEEKTISEQSEVINACITFVLSSLIFICMQDTRAYGPRSKQFKLTAFIKSK
jgi:hypothetical protein